MRGILMHLALAHEALARSGLAPLSTPEAPSEPLATDGEKEGFRVKRNTLPPSPTLQLPPLPLWQVSPRTSAIILKAFLSDDGSTWKKEEGVDIISHICNCTLGSPELNSPSRSSRSKRHKLWLSGLHELSLCIVSTIKEKRPGADSSCVLSTLNRRRSTSRPSLNSNSNPSPSSHPQPTDTLERNLLFSGSDLPPHHHALLLLLLSKAVRALASSFPHDLDHDKSESIKKHPTSYLSLLPLPHTHDSLAHMSNDQDAPVLLDHWCGLVLALSDVIAPRQVRSSFSLSALALLDKSLGNTTWNSCKRMSTSLIVSSSALSLLKELDDQLGSSRGSGGGGDDMDWSSVASSILSIVESLVKCIDMASSITTTLVPGSSCHKLASEGGGSAHPHPLYLLRHLSRRMLAGPASLPLILSNSLKQDGSFSSSSSLSSTTAAEVWKGARALSRLAGLVGKSNLQPVVTDVTLSVTLLCQALTFPSSFPSPSLTVLIAPRLIQQTNVVAEVSGLGVGWIGLAPWMTLDSDSNSNISLPWALDLLSLILRAQRTLRLEFEFNLDTLLQGLEGEGHVLDPASSFDSAAYWRTVHPSLPPEVSPPSLS